MEYNKIQEAMALATPVPHVFSAADTDPALVVQYVPRDGTGGTAATCQVITATSLTFTVDGAAPAGADAIGSSGAVNFATYTTLGDLRDYIHKLGPWRCYLQGALRADASASKLLTAAAASCIGANGLTILHDTSETLFISVAISGEKFSSNGPKGYHSDDEDKCLNSLMRFAINLDMGANGTVKLYSSSQTADNLIATYTLTDATELEKVVNLVDAYAMGTLGQRLIVRANIGTSLTTLTKFEVLGKTAVLTGSRVVTGKNY